MGNDTSVPLKLQKKNKDGTLIEDCNQKATITVPKAKSRNTSKSRGRKQSKDESGQTTPSSSDGLQPPHPGAERKRSKSLCAAELEKVGQNGLTPQKSEDKDLKGRKSSSGLVPSFNRLRIQQCYKTAKPTMGEAILKRASGSRPELRAVFSRLKEEDYTEMATNMHLLLSEAVSHLDSAEEVLIKAKAYGESFAALCPLGFRPDLFFPLADAAIAECVKLDSGLHKRCETLQAWSQLIGALFSSVRDGYYLRIRFQRRSSLPQHTVTKQLSIDVSRLQPTVVE